MELQRRASAARRQADDPGAPGDCEAAQRRRTFRTVVTVNLTYKREDQPGVHLGTATDLSAGGLRLTCNEALLPDQLLILTFTPPSAVLGSFPDQIDEVDISPFGPRIVKKHIRYVRLRRSGFVPESFNDSPILADGSSWAFSFSRSMLSIASKSRAIFTPRKSTNCASRESKRDQPNADQRQQDAGPLNRLQPFLKHDARQEDGAGRIERSKHRGD